MLKYRKITGVSLINFSPARSLFILLLLAVLTASGFPVTVNSMNYLEINNYFRIVLDVDYKIQEFRHQFDETKGILAIEFDEPLEYGKTMNIPKNSFVDRIFIQKNSKDSKGRMLFYTKGVFKVNIFPVGGISAISPKFIITFFKKKTSDTDLKTHLETKPAVSPKQEVPEQRKPSREKSGTIEKEADRENIKKLEYKNPIIVIDPGHGGKDPGAVSVGKKLEKDLVFDIALRVKRILKEYSDNSLDLLMTREKDEFIKLEDRLEFADSKGADVFVSIHANASVENKSRGIEVYYKGKASDKEAERLAKLENSANLNGLTNFSKIRNKTVTKILLDMMETKNLKDSSTLAINVSEKLELATEKHYKGKSRGIKRAEFHVLQSFRTPSVLIEVGFLSNRFDDRLLAKKWYRELISSAIADGILTYLIKTTKDYSLSLKKLEEKINSKKMLTYKVKKGDTLSGIADKYDVSLKDILSINGIKNSDSLQIGQELNIIMIK